MVTMLETYLRSSLRRTVRSEEGATAVEYGIMVALIAAVIIAAVIIIGQQLNITFEGVGEELQKVNSG